MIKRGRKEEFVINERVKEKFVIKGGKEGGIRIKGLREIFAINEKLEGEIHDKGRKGRRNWR